MSLEHASDMIQLFDKNEDGSLDFQEFVQLLMYDTQDQVLYDKIGEK